MEVVHLFLDEGEGGGEGVFGNCCQLKENL